MQPGQELLPLGDAHDERHNALPCTGPVPPPILAEPARWTRDRAVVELLADEGCRAGFCARNAGQVRIVPPRRPGRASRPSARGCQVGILGTVAACEAALPRLRQSGAGAIVAIGTVSAAEATVPRVRCNVVAPGTVFFDGGVWDVVRQRAPDRFAEAPARSPMGRMGRPGEVASAVVFLASPRASFISGARLRCDGARTEGVQC